MHGPTITSGFLSLITAGDGEFVPFGIPYGALELESLDTPEVKAWLEQNSRYAIYVMAGAKLETKGVPAITVRSTTEDYERVLAAVDLIDR